MIPQVRDTACPINLANFMTIISEVVMRNSNPFTRGIKLIEVYKKYNSNRVVSMNEYTIFLLVSDLCANNAWASQTQIAKMSGLSPNVVNRNLSTLASYSRANNSLNLIEMDTDPNDRRYRRYKLTNKGLALRTEMLAITQKY